MMILVPDWSPLSCTIATLMRYSPALSSFAFPAPPLLVWFGWCLSGWFGFCSWVVVSLAWLVLLCPPPPLKLFLALTQARDAWSSVDCEILLICLCMVAD